MRPPPILGTNRWLTTQRNVSARRDRICQGVLERLDVVHWLFSVEFCHQIGLDYVSCSPFRVPVARLAAAKAALSGAVKKK